MDRRFARVSSWYRLTKAVAWILRLKSKLRKKTVTTGSLSVEEISCAEDAIIKAVQPENFPKEMGFLCAAKGSMAVLESSSSPLKKLSPVCVSRVLRVGGRLRRARIEFEAQHPAILPSNFHVTRLLIEEQHR